MKGYRTGKITFSVPESYHPTAPVRKGHMKQMSFTADTDNAGCFVTVKAVSPEEQLPFDREEAIGLIRESLSDNQGIVEIETGADENRQFTYSIVKHLISEDGVPAGMRYLLLMDISLGRDTLQAFGRFDECGITGIRDNLVHNILEKTGAMEGFDGWYRDPYDSCWEQGMLMNLSEERRFDELFPSHPLSLARSFADHLLTHTETGRRGFPWRLPDWAN